MIGNLNYAYLIFAGAAIIVSIAVSFINEYKYNKDHQVEAVYEELEADAEATFEKPKKA